MKRMIISHTTEDGRWYPDDENYRGLKETDFVYTGNRQGRWPRVFIARDGSLWYRYANRWCRTYANSDYIFFSPKDHNKYAHLHAGVPEHEAEYERIKEEAFEDLAKRDNRGY